MKSVAAPLLAGFFVFVTAAITEALGDPTSSGGPPPPPPPGGSATPFTCSLASGSTTGDSYCDNICKVNSGSASVTGCCMATGSNPGTCLCCSMLASNTLPISTAATCSDVRSGCRCNCVTPKSQMQPCSGSKREEMELLREYIIIGQNDTLGFNALFGDFSF